MKLRNEILNSLKEYTQTSDNDIIVNYLSSNLKKESHLTRYGNFGLDNSGMKNFKRKNNNTK
tara:strand:- start:1405 stop:1590 length:186 start_codon:yes stop_codon:yes gene_type:complete